MSQKDDNLDDWNDEYPTLEEDYGGGDSDSGSSRHKVEINGNQVTITYSNGVTVTQTLDNDDE